MSSEYTLTLTAEEKAEILRVAERFAIQQSRSANRVDETKLKVLNAFVDFAKDFRATPELYIKCSRVFIKLLRVQLQVHIAKLDQTLERYSNMDGGGAPFEPMVIGRRKEDYLKNAQTRKSVYSSVVSKIQELVG